MAMKLLIGCVLFAVAAAESTLEALEADDTCVEGDCSLELNQLRGMKVNYHDVLMEEEDEEEEVTVEGGACTGCVKASCRPGMKSCSGLNAGGH